MTFASSRDTLFLMSKDGAASAAPLVAALTDAVIRAGVSSLTLLMIGIAIYSWWRDRPSQ